MRNEGFDEIYVEYAQLHKKILEYKKDHTDMDEVAKALPTLFAAQFLARRISAENDRLIQSLSSLMNEN